MNRIVYTIMAVIAGLVISITGAGSANAATDPTYSQVAYVVKKDFQRHSFEENMDLCTTLAYMPNAKRTSMFRSYAVKAGYSARIGDFFNRANANACLDLIRPTY